MFPQVKTPLSLSQKNYLSTETHLTVAHYENFKLESPVLVLQVPLVFSPDLTPLRQQMQRTKLTSQVNSSRLSLPANLRMSPRLVSVNRWVFLNFIQGGIRIQQNGSDWI